MRELLLSFFPDLSDKQLEQFELLPDLYAEWNSKINVISRKDIDELPLHHVLHSLSIAKYIRFAPNTNIMDVGTGGGFPGIPMAIFFPDVQFLLLDSIGKKFVLPKKFQEPSVYKTFLLIMLASRTKKESSISLLVVR